MDKKQEVDQSVIDVSSSVSTAGADNHVRPELLQSLSAMMDDEADPLELRRVVKALDSTPELNDHWRRYHAVRASLRQDLHQRPDVDLLAGVKARLAAEQEPVRFRGARWTGKALRFAGQGLVAASVAAAVLLAYPALKGTAPGRNVETLAAAEQAVPVTSQATLPQLSGDYNASPLTRTVRLDDAARHRLEKAVRNFSGTSAVLNSNSMPMLATQLEPFSPARATPTEQAEPRK